MDDDKNLPVFAEIWTAANQARNSMLSGYIRHIARFIAVWRSGLRRETDQPDASRNQSRQRQDADPSRRINDLIWKRISLLIADVQRKF
jgi:hypothetical protein